MKRLHTKKVTYSISFQLVRPEKDKGKLAIITETVQCILAKANFPKEAIESLVITEEVK